MPERERGLEISPGDMSETGDGGAGGSAPFEGDQALSLANLEKISRYIPIAYFEVG